MYGCLACCPSPSVAGWPRHYGLKAVRSGPPLKMVVAAEDRP
jgi:hypothetical protein